MASPIISFAQDEIAIPCDLCDMPADSYCRECLAQVCENCKQSHLQHTIVHVIEGLFENLHVLKCSKHNSRFTNYCKLCRVNICDRCTTTDHRGHEREPVGKQAETLKQNFSQKVNNEKAHLKKIQVHLCSIKERLEYFDTHTQSEIDKVHSELDRKKELLDKEGEKIIESLKQEYKIASKKLNTHYRQLKVLDDKLNELIESIEGKLANIPDEAVYNFVIENEKELETSTASLTFNLPSPSVFKPSNYKYEEQSDVLGSLVSVRPTNLNITFDPHPESLLDAKQSTPTDPPSGVSIAQVAKPEVIVYPSLRRKLNIISKFRPTGSAVFSISATDDDMLWVGTSDHKLVLVDKTGEQKLKVNMPDVPWFTAVTRAGDALVSTIGHAIYKVTRRFLREPKVSTFVDVSPGTVYGITATQDGDVFACVHSGSVLSGVYKVKKFSSEGKFVLELDSAIFTPGNCLLFVHAARDDVVCVQDGHRSNAECPLVFVTAAGQLVSRVTRTKKLGEHTRAIVWDDHGNMLTCKWHGEYIHVFSGEGACKQSYKVTGASLGITTLCLGKDGAVWIGTDRGEVINARRAKHGTLLFRTFFQKCRKMGHNSSEHYMSSSVNKLDV